MSAWPSHPVIYELNTAAWLHDRQPRLVTSEHWATIDAHERELGAPAQRPRVKLTRVAELLAVGHGA